MRLLFFAMILGFGLSAQAEVQFREDNPFPESVREFITKELERRCPAIVTLKSPAETDRKIFTQNVGAYQDMFFAILLSYDSFEGRTGMFPGIGRGAHFADQMIQLVVRKGAFALNENDLELVDIQSSEGVCLYDSKAENND